MAIPDSFCAGWQVLDVGSIWMKEFSFALNTITPTLSWLPDLTALGHWQNWERLDRGNEPAIDIHRFPLQRGYAHFPVNLILPFQRKLMHRLRDHSRSVTHPNLLCTTPFYAPVAEEWLGPVVYYVTDLTKKYEGCNERQVIKLDKRLCARATLVCPNSRRIAEYLSVEAGCDRKKLVLVPNATRSSNVPDQPLNGPAKLPASIAHLKRPVVGVIGNLAANMDWLLLKKAITLKTGISWVFVGPTNMPVRNQAQSEARKWVIDQACFVGPKPYGELQAYARSFDVSVLPYLRREPTYSGSSTRFYEHLPSSRPMIGSRGFAELLEKEPLINLVDNAEELIDELDKLQRTGFQDGHEVQRWTASRSATWESRAQTIVSACSQQLHADAARRSPASELFQ